MPMMNPESGAGFLLPVDKPDGPTSHDIVHRARRALGIRRIGHTGTLDPFASGLLILCVGSATRLAEYLDPHSKTYRARVRLGVATDTDDRTGTVLAESDSWMRIDRAAVEQTLSKQLGDVLQMPPAYSAKKVGGERMYAVMRRGGAAEVRPSRVRIETIRIDSFDAPDLDLEITCGTGTYIRAIARDIGNDLGCGAHLVELRRTRIGPFDVEAALSLEQLGEAGAVAERRVDPLQALGDIPRIEVAAGLAESIRHGRGIEVTGAPESGRVAIVFDGRLLAMGESVAGEIRPRKVFGS
jgi:tRNA pseudouridine55 synthase